MELAGYKLVYMPDHPRSFKSGGSKGYVYEHILVAESSIGRQLKSSEVVHHIDRDRTNNSPSNLMVFDSNSSHAAFHMQGCGCDVIRKNDGTFSVPSQHTTCEVCGGRAMSGRHICFECFIEARRHLRVPPLADLLEDIKSMPYVAIGRKYGVSDNAVRKWMREYGVNDENQKVFRKACKN